MANSSSPSHPQLASRPAKSSRREFLANAAVGTAAFSLAASGLRAQNPPQAIASSRILVGSGAPGGILSFAWDAQTGNLKPEGSAAPFSHSTWLEISPDRRFLYVASEVDDFQGKPTGAVASFALAKGKLTPISMVAAQGKGTCHVTTDHTGRVVICANYGGGSAASFLATDGKLSEAVWSEHYVGYPGADGKEKPGPIADRQEAAHAHFACVSPDNGYAYINDLGADKIHIYRIDRNSGVLTPAGEFKSYPGAGPRTLHFRNRGHIKKGSATNLDWYFTYCLNELDSTVDVLEWNPNDGSLSLLQQVELLPPGTTGVNRACDTVLSRDGRFAYFANRDHDFLMSFTIDPASGKLKPLGKSPRTSCGGKIPRNFRLDPTERWMLVANQDSSNIAVFARNPSTGELADEGNAFAAPTPMCIVFV